MQVSAPHLDRMHITDARRVCDRCGRVEGSVGPCVGVVLRNPSVLARRLGVNVSLCPECLVAAWVYIEPSSLVCARASGLRRARRKPKRTGAPRRSTHNIDRVGGWR